MNENVSDVIEYDKDFEDLCILYLMATPDLFVRCKGILKSEYFDDKQNRDTVAFIESYYNSHSGMASPEQIKAVTKKNIDLTGLDLTDDTPGTEWFLKQFEKFCQHKALRDAILRSPKMLEEGRYGEVEVAIKQAVQIALVKDLGLDYFANPKSRLEALKNNKGQVSTGWKVVDEKLYGGLNRGEVTIFAGQSGAGKSLFLQNLAVNWASAGLNVVYLSLELSEKLCSMRIDAMHTNYETREIMRNIEDVHMKIRSIHQKNKGNLQIKQLPNGCTSNDVRAYIKEYEIHSGRKVDAVLVDYIDLMYPMSKKISAENLFIKDKYVTEELRNLAVELDILCVSASQLNRGSYEEIDFDPSHIAGGISKVQTADNVIGIFTSIAMRDAGRYQIQFMKTRSSSGVGSKIDLAFNNKSLRIYDLAEDDDNTATATTKDVFEKLKKKSVVKVEQKEEKPEKVDNLEGAAALMKLIKKLDK